MIWYIIYILILTFGFVVGSFKFNVISKSNKCFLLLLLITLISEIVARRVATNGNSNFIVYHIFAPIRCMIILLGYYFDIKNRLFLYLIPVIVLISLVLSIFIQPLPNFNSYFINLEFFLFTIIPIYFFLQILKVETEYGLNDFPLFWISCGMLIFCVCNIFVLGTFNFFLKSNTILDVILRYVRYFSNYIYYSSFIVAFLVKQNTISDQHGK